MGPRSRYLGPDVPKEVLIWQDPIPEVDHELVDSNDISDLKEAILSTDLSLSELISTAWASASTFRGSDKRGGANGGRISLEPQVNWEVNSPNQLKNVLSVLNKIRDTFISEQSNGKSISIADIIILGGCAAIEKAAKNAGNDINVPFRPGRTDAKQDQTDISSFSVLEPNADGFRNYSKNNFSISTEEMLIDKAQLLTLSAPEMTVLIGGLRVLNINTDNSKHGVFTDKKDALTNDFFVNLLDLNISWSSKSNNDQVFEGRDRGTNEIIWTGTRVDLIFGSNSELRSLAEVYACSDSNDLFINDFVAAWDKVMNLDRF
tara:strand:- start:222 stop:1178 length:957 start_codon:yes stop_codon:yes gene_type:complete